MMRTHSSHTCDAYVQRVAAFADYLGTGRHKDIFLFHKMLYEANGLGSQWNAGFFAKRRLNRVMKTRKGKAVRFEKNIRTGTFRSFSIQLRYGKRYSL